MAAFASLDDYTAWYKYPSDPERVETVLSGAGDFLESELLRCGRQVDDDDELQHSALVRISCRLAHDMCESPTDMAGVSQSSMTAGPFTGSWTFSNPTGAFQLLRSERKTLGIGGLRAGSVAPLVHDA